MDGTYFVLKLAQPFHRLADLLVIGSYLKFGGKGVLTDGKRAFGLRPSALETQRFPGI